MNVKPSNDDSLLLNTGTDSPHYTDRLKLALLFFEMRAMRLIGSMYSKSLGYLFHTSMGWRPLALGTGCRCGWNGCCPKFVIRGQYREWIDMNMAAGYSPLDYRVADFKEIETKQRELLLPWYHLSAEQNIALKNRQAYKTAIRKGGES